MGPEDFLFLECFVLASPGVVKFVQIEVQGGGPR